MTNRQKGKEKDSIFSDRDKHQRFYQSKAWQRLRLYQLSVEPLCEHCSLSGCTEPATVADHIVSLTLNYDRRLDPDNLQSLCDRCHNIKSRQEQIQYRRAEQQVRIDDRMNELNDL